MNSPSVITEANTYRLPPIEEKCKFSVSAVIFLGYLMSHKTVKPYEQRLKSSIHGRKLEFHPYCIIYLYTVLRGSSCS